MNIEHLFGLFQAGHYKKCLSSLDDFLHLNANQASALLLKAKCLFEISSDKNGDFEDAYHQFIKVLEVDSHNAEALEYAVYIAIYLSQKHTAEAISLCDQWLQFASPKEQIIVHRFRAEANRICENFADSLKDYNKVIAVAKLVYANYNSKLNRALAAAYEAKGHIYLNNLKEPQMALDVFKRSFQYLYTNDLVYAEIAQLAFQHHDYDFAGAAAHRLFALAEQLPVTTVCELYQQIDALLDRAIINKNLVYAKLVASKVFRDVVEINPLDNLSFIRRCITIYPDWHVPYHYYGAELFDAEGYQESLPYIQKSLELGGLAFDVSRYLEASYRAKKELPTMEKWPVDEAENYYNAGLAFYDAELKLRNEANKSWFLENRAKFFEKAFNTFYAYFYEQVGHSLNGNLFTFVKCCNDYGKALASMEQYTEADRIHAIGDSLFYFGEQLCNWSAVLIKLERYEEALSKVQKVLQNGTVELEFDTYVQLRAREALALYHLNKIAEASAILATTESEYDQFLRANRLSEQDKYDLAECYVDLQHLRFKLLQIENTAYAIEIWQQQLDKNPDDQYSWLMLMQRYHEIGDHKQCIACANNYLALKSGVLLAETALQVYYRRGLAFAKTDAYERALSDLNFVLELHYKKKPLCHADFVELTKNMAYCYFKLANWLSCIGFTQLAMDIFAINDWPWNQNLVDILMLYAQANYAKGNQRKAIKALDRVLLYQPENQEALQKRQAYHHTGFLGIFKR